MFNLIKFLYSPNKVYRQAYIWLFGLTCIVLEGHGCTNTEDKSTNDSKTLFSLLDPLRAGIDFENSLKNRKGFNIYRYRNFYNAGGVAIGDINNDSLPDVSGDGTFDEVLEKA